MRLRYVGIHGFFLLKYFQGGLPVTRVENPLPLDSKVVSVGHDYLGRINLLIESSEFADLEEGSEIPEHKVLFHKI